jgi:hypothetical protein
MTIPQFEDLARDMVGDGKDPDVFFVSRKGTIELVTSVPQMAYDYWRSLPISVETALENRQWGTICSNEPDSDDPNSRLRLWDDFQYFLRQRNDRRTTQQA